MDKPRQGLNGLVNINIGFFGIQVGFALQNANMSRVFQTLGSSIDDLPALWIAAPLTGLLVQPVVGHLSDRTWLGRLGRRRPYFLAGAVLAGIALVAMPFQQALLGAALLLWLLDASLNVSMEPFRAFVGDMLRKDQHTLGYAVQTAFIGMGAVVGSLFPWLLDHIGISNSAAPGVVPDTVRFSFVAGAFALMLAVGWTIATTREYSPDQQAEWRGPDALGSSEAGRLASACLRPGLIWIAAGAAIAFVVAKWRLEKELYLLAGLLGGYGLARTYAIMLVRNGADTNLLTDIVGEFAGMPAVMKRLALVQFLSWSSLFVMWINTTPAVAQTFFGASNPADPRYQAAGNWVGVLFAVYNGVAAPAALLLPLLAKRVGQAKTHAICLLAGAAGFAGFFVAPSAQVLLACEVGIGIAWASILAMPYAMLASSLPQAKLGVYMGLFNAFVVLPQLLVATALGALMKMIMPGQALWTMGLAAASLSAAALATLVLLRRT